MNKIIRLYNQNRRLFMMIVIIIISFLIGLYIINYLIKEQNQNNNILINNRYTEGESKAKEEESYQVTTGESQDINVYSAHEAIIQDFVNKCKTKEYENAYSLVADECKERNFPTIEDFKNNYVDEIFDEDKSCSVQAWNNNTYLVKITGDLLSTGKASDDSYIEEYMTIVSSNKININNYISSQTLDLKQEKANVEINIKKIDFYMDYCLIDINVNNKRKTPILLDSKEESGNIYLEDKFKIKYECENYNIDKIDLVIEADNNKDYTLKFDLPSNKRSDLTSLHFSKILSDYNQYKQIGDSRTISIEAQL